MPGEKGRSVSPSFESELAFKDEFDFCVRSLCRCFSTCSRDAVNRFASPSISTRMVTGDFETLERWLPMPTRRRMRSGDLPSGEWSILSLLYPESLESILRGFCILKYLAVSFGFESSLSIFRGCRDRGLRFLAWRREGKACFVKTGRFVLELSRALSRILADEGESLLAGVLRAFGEYSWLASLRRSLRPVRCVNLSLPSPSRLSIEARDRCRLKCLCWRREGRLEGRRGPADDIRLTRVWRSANCLAFLIL
mmetsp:Transcript_952/g.1739  ORF Transcript_952/g.1739 Transcript_952/m.1739 type:complete len:253 (-) Transcript_952:708-1466(-)